MFLSQKKYTLRLLERAHMANCNPTQTSVDTESKVDTEGDPVSDPSLYRSLAVRVLHVPSSYQYADIFTKGLPSALFEEFRTSLSVRPSPAQTARKC
nr:ribonuclease H-like domain-containing protein [Tanacetum cinerariifolium]